MCAFSNHLMVQSYCLLFCSVYEENKIKHFRDSMYTLENITMIVSSV